MTEHAEHHHTLSYADAIRSIPATRGPRAASGKAMQPVPMGNSSTGPSPASAARNATAGSSTAGSNIGAS